MDTKNEFIKFVKEEYGIDIITQPSETPDTFENIFGTSFVNMGTTMDLIEILDTDDCVVEYDKEHGTYRVSIFEDCHYKDEYWFDEYKVRCKDCKSKHYSESHNLWCDIFERIMPEDGYCCFGER